MKKDWTKDIHDRLSDYKKDAPDELFDDIVKEMSRRGIAPVPCREKRTRVIPMWVKTGAAAAVLVAGLFFWRSFNDGGSQIVPQPTNNGSLASAGKSGGGSASDGITDDDGDGVSAVSSAVKSAYNSVYNKVRNATGSANGDNLLAMATASVDGSDADGMVATASIAAAEQTTAEQTWNNVGATEHKSESARQRLYYNNSTSTRNGAGGRPSAVRRTTSDRGSNSGAVTIGPYYSGGMSGNGIANDYSLSTNVYSEPAPEGDVLKNAAFIPQNNYEIDHHQPVKVGVSVSFPLTDRWSLQTGLTYSYLSSEVTQHKNIVTNSDAKSSTVAGYTSYSATQKLHYIGVPLSVAYKLWSNKSLDIYLSGGGEVEKLVKGSCKADKGYESKKVNGIKVGDITEGQMQFSLNAGAGLQYNITPLVSAYAEPGVSYYPDNGSDVQNIYKDKKVNFNLNIGMRININK